MAKDYINIGPSPYGEDCAQVGEDNYRTKARRECVAYVNQLRRVHGAEPEGAQLVVKSFPHDFGSYYEVCCYYDEGFPASVDYAFKCEGESPEQWDDEAKAELVALGVA